MHRLILTHLQEVPKALLAKLLSNAAWQITRTYSAKTLALECQHALSVQDKRQLQQLAMTYQTDTIFLKEGFQPEQIRLLAFDMDSTLINIECIDEIARQSGKMAEVSKITEATMRGEITDFTASLQARVYLLKGVTEQALESVYRERLQLSPGAENFIRSAQALGWKTLLVSGGFTFFTERIKKRLQLDEAHANTLEIIQGVLTGKVLGPVVDGIAKAQYVRNTCAQLQLPTSAAMVMGDGSNDLPMMALAGLSIGYQPKPIVQEKADGTFHFVGLDGALDLFTKT